MGKRVALFAALAALLAVSFTPALQDLRTAGQVMPTMLAFAVIVWMTGVLDHAVSAVVIGTLMIFLLADLQHAGLRWYRHEDHTHRSVVAVGLRVDLPDLDGLHVQSGLIS